MSEPLEYNRLTTAYVASLCGVSIEAVQKWARKHIKKDRLTGWYLFSKEDVERFKSRRKTPGRVPQ